MRRMISLQGIYQELRTQYVEMIGDRHDFGFVVEMTNGCLFVATRNNPKGSILTNLKQV
jgi:hypothetical protein